VVIRVALARDDKSVRAAITLLTGAPRRAQRRPRRAPVSPP